MPSTRRHPYDLNFKLKFVAKTEAAMAIFAIDLWSGLPYLVGARLGICSIVSDVNHFKHVLFSKFALSGVCVESGILP